MPRTHRPPTYRLHKARNLAVSTTGGNNHYLGAYGSLESYRNYLELVSDWICEKFGPDSLTQSNSSDANSGLIINQLILEYWEFASNTTGRMGRRQISNMGFGLPSDIFANSLAIHQSPTSARAI